MTAQTQSSAPKAKPMLRSSGEPITPRIFRGLLKVSIGLSILVLATLMVDVLMGQLIHGANLMAIREGQLVGYVGWLRVERLKAEAWRRGETQIPPPDWAGGDAAISTIVVADNPADLPALIRGVSHVCAGLPVYRMRAFNDGRPDRKRAPITGRKQDFAGGS